MSIQSIVTKKYQELNNPTLKDLRESLPNIDSTQVKTCYYRAKKVSQGVDTNDPTISMDLMEKLLMKQLKRKPDIPTLRLMVDFLKLKSQDHSELQEIDLEIFYKKAMMD